MVRRRGSKRRIGKILVSDKSYAQNLGSNKIRVGYEDLDDREFHTRDFKNKEDANKFIREIKE